MQSFTFAGQRVAMRVQSDANTTGVVTWLHGDHLGSASVATDAGGNKIANSDSRYLPFGEARSGFAGSGLPTDRRFTGQISVAGGLIDFGARFLDPLLGRFISADTIVPNPADPQSLNRYSYVRNSPLVYTDPTGHTQWLEGNQSNNDQISLLAAQYEAKYAVRFSKFTDINELKLVTEVLDDFAQQFGSANAFNTAIKESVKLQGGQNDWLILEREANYSVRKTAGWLPKDGKLVFGNDTFNGSLNYFVLPATQKDLINRIVIGHELGTCS